MQRQELLHRTRTADEYAFRHALVRDAAYATLPPDDRVRAHRRAAEWLVGRGENDSLRVADHFEHAGERERAIDALVRATDSMYETMRNAGAMLARGRRLGATGDPLGQLLSHELFRVMWQGGVVNDTIAIAEEALACAEPGTMAWFNAATVFVFTAAHSSRERVDELLGYALQRPMPDHISAAQAVNAFSMGLVGSKQPVRAAIVLAHARKTTFSAPASSGWIRIAQVWPSMFVDGDLGAVIESMPIAEALFERDPAGAVNVRYLLAWAQHDAGLHEEALANATEATRMGGALIGGRFMLTEHAKLVAASAMLAMGNTRGAAEHLLPLLRVEDGVVSQRAQHLFAAVALAEGRIDDAERIVASVRHGQFAYALIDVVGSGAALARGDVPLAVARAEKALESATNGATAPSLIGDAALQLAAALRAADAHERAREIVTAAVARLEVTERSLAPELREAFRRRDARLRDWGPAPESCREIARR